MDGIVWLNVPPHAPGVLHGVSLVLVDAHFVGHSVVADLESHHPGGSIALEGIVVWSSDVVLDQHFDSVILVVDSCHLLHVFIKYKGMLVSEDHEAVSVLPGRDDEGVSKHLREVAFTIQWVLLWLLPR